ncbi:MAG: HD-GYP domain-containing protein [Burkholderiaceae bacterium]
MSTASPARHWQDTAHARPLTSQKRFRVTAERLSMGMFVVELDRPWLDTPFLIQGFLVDSAIELSTLRKYCRHVFVDLELSRPDVADAIRAGSEVDEFDVDASGEADASPGHGDAAPQAAPNPETQAAPGSAHDEDRAQAEATGEDAESGLPTVPAAPADGAPRPTRAPARPRTPERAYRIRADVRITTDTRERFRHFIRGAPVVSPAAAEDSFAARTLAKLRGLLGGARGDAASRYADPAAAAQASAAEIEAELRAALPPDAKLKTYVERHPVARELPRARDALTRGEEILSAVIADVRNGRAPQVEQVSDVVDAMVESMIDNPDALLWVAQLREDHVQTYHHGVRVALYLIALGRQLGFPRVQMGQLGMIGMLADIGKTRLPRALLEKPGMLVPAEYSIVKEHVRLGLELLAQDMTFAPEIGMGIAQHHERLDGSGYPKGLRGDEISIYGRMAGIADSFAALITPRAYANPLAPQDALMNLYQWAGTSFHAPLVEQFVQAVGVFPVGSLVELSSGEIAVVLAHNRVRRLEPRVLVLTGPDKRPLPVPLERDLLMQQPRDAAARPVRIVRGLPSGAYGLKLRDYYASELANADGLA